MTTPYEEQVDTILGGMRSLAGLSTNSSGYVRDRYLIVALITAAREEGIKQAEEQFVGMSSEKRHSIIHNASYKAGVSDTIARVKEYIYREAILLPGHGGDMWKISKKAINDLEQELTGKE